MANVDRSPVPVLAGELHDLMAELRTYYTDVWLVVENKAPRGAQPYLEMRLICTRWQGKSPEAHYRLSEQIPANKTPDLDERAYRLLWGAVDALILQGHLRVEDDPA